MATMTQSSASLAMFAPHSGLPALLQSCQTPRFSLARTPPPSLLVTAAPGRFHSKKYFGRDFFVLLIKPSHLPRVREILCLILDFPLNISLWCPTPLVMSGGCAKLRKSIDRPSGRPGALLSTMR